MSRAPIKAYTLHDLSKLLGKSKQHTRRLLIDRPCGERVTRGGSCKEYQLQDLPETIQREIVSQELSIDIDFVPSSEINQDEVGRLLEAWESAPQWNCDIAILRKGILDALIAFAASNDLPITTAEHQFCELYKSRSGPYIEEDCYGRIDSLSAPTLNLWRRKFKALGLVGLLTSYGGKSGKYFALTPEMRIFLTSQLALNPDIRVKRLHEMIEQVFPQSKPPDPTTVGNWVKNEWRGKGARNEELHMRRENPQEWRNKFLPAFGNRTADAPFFCHTWEADSTCNDVVLNDGVRYALIFNVDVYSRRLKIVRQPTSTSIGIAACIREAMIDWGIPKRVRKDNGKDYSSAHMDAVFTSLGIETPPLPPYAPDRKGCIERAIGTFNRYVAELLPGFCGHNVSDRQALRERGLWMKKLQMSGEPVRLSLSPTQFDEITQSFINKYERTPHRGLGGKAPFQMSLESKRQPAKIRDERVLDLLLAPVAARTVQKRGIELAGGFYTSPELVDHIGKRVHLRRDLCDAGQLFVFEVLDEAQGRARFLCKAFDAALSGEKLEEYIAARARKNKSQREKSRALNILSKTTPEPYTILLGPGEIIEEPAKIVPFQAEADSPAIREARRAVDDQGQQNPVQLITGCTVIESASRFERADANSKWDQLPQELLDNPIEIFAWYDAKREAVGLSDDDNDYLRYLKREFPRQSEAYSDMQKEKAAFGAQPSQIP